MEGQQSFATRNVASPILCSFTPRFVSFFPYFLVILIFYERMMIQYVMYAFFTSILKEECGATQGWYTCQCRIYTVKGLSGQ